MKRREIEIEERGSENTNAQNIVDVVEILCTHTHVQ